MHKSVTAIHRFYVIILFLSVFTCSNNPDGLIINPVSTPTIPPDLYCFFSPKPRGIMQDRRTTNYVHNLMGTHHQWTGILLLSLLQQEDDAFGNHLDKSQQLLSMLSSTSLSTANGDETIKVRLNGKSFERDKVERILDANTIQLKRKGVVKLAGVRMPSVGAGGTNGNFQFPTCFAYSPSYKIRQLLPKNTVVQIQTVVGTSSNNKIPLVVLIRNDDSLVVNEELVKTGFAVVKNGFAKQQSSLSSSSELIIDADSLTVLEESARSKGLGIFAECSTEKDDGIAANSFVAEFEPIERSMETVYLSDGGKRQPRDESTKITFSKENPPKNPGDTKGCSDFETFEDALQWFETYKPYYGDVAKLDRDGDGVPCPGLSHTSNRERYRMKVPTASVGIK